jgi:hypothetical protein
MDDRRTTQGVNPVTSSAFLRPAAAAAAILALGIAIGARLPTGRGLPTAHAVSATADDSFAVCTAPLGDGAEGFFILDFETGDLSGGVLGTQNPPKFARGYRHNVLKDLGFKPGKVKAPRFLMVSGVSGFLGGGTQLASLASSVLYVTDAATGVTVAYGIPWNAVAGPAAAAELVPLDVARPRAAGKAP